MDFSPKTKNQFEHNSENNVIDEIDENLDTTNTLNIQETAIVNTRGY